MAILWDHVTPKQEVDFYLLEMVRESAREKFGLEIQQAIRYYNFLVFHFSQKFKRYRFQVIFMRKILLTLATY